MNCTQKTSKKYFQYHSKPPLYTSTTYRKFSYVPFLFLEIFWSAQSHFSIFVRFSLVATAVENHFIFFYIFKTRHISQNSHWIYSVRKDVHRNFAKFTEKHLYQNLFFHKFVGWGLQLYQKRDFGTSVSLWILQNFYEHHSF